MKIFELAGQLKQFKGLDLDVHRKIANLGEKTFRWEAPGESYEVKFNYTLNTQAQHTGDTVCADLRGIGAPAGIDRPAQQAHEV